VESPFLFKNTGNSMKAALVIRAIAGLPSDMGSVR
jgi:hypothetical protein